MSPAPSNAQQPSNPSSLHEPPAPLSDAQPEVSPAEAKKMTRLEAKIAALESQILEVEEKQKAMDGKLKTKDPQATVKAHIKLLHEYNEIRDIGQGLIGIIAENRGVRVSEAYKDFDVEEGD